MSEKTIKIFISSPSDVRTERLIVERVIIRLDREFCNYFKLMPILWEREPLIASHHFQDKIIPPHETDIVVLILWSRLGISLPQEKFSGPISGKEVTGTEWEFEDALKSHRLKESPEILVYKKNVSVVVSIDDESHFEQLKLQKQLVNNFIDSWFFDKATNAFSAAFREFENEIEFEEMLEIHLRELLKKRMSYQHLVSDNNNRARWHKGNPFKGLLSFDLDYSQVFFGRTRARNELREMLKRQIAKKNAFILVVGASGSGKSSLVQSGFLSDISLPGMIDQVALLRYVVFTPSTGTGDLLTKLVQAILSDTAIPEMLMDNENASQHLNSLLHELPNQIIWPIQQGLKKAGETFKLTHRGKAKLCIIIDQFEEIFTLQTITQEEREAFIIVLEVLAKSGLVWIVSTMRADFFDKLESLPRLATLSADSRYLLIPVDSIELNQIIRQPALEAGLTYEYDEKTGLTLDEVIQKAASLDNNSLPLLSFLLEQLWYLKTINGIMTFESYYSLGGLEGAIGIRADQVFSKLSPEIKLELSGLIRSLVVIDLSGKIVSRWAPWFEISVTQNRIKLAEALLDSNARLLVIDQNDFGVQVHIAHEALLIHWQEIRFIIEKDRRDLELRSALEQMAMRWHSASVKEKKNLLLQKGQFLHEANNLSIRWINNLNATVVNFIKCSNDEVRKKFKHQTILIFTSLISAPLITGLVWIILMWNGVHSIESELSFVKIPAGCFEMGSTYDKDTFDKPVHNVCIKSFYMATNLITRDQWKKVFIHNPDPATHKERGDLPVETVSWKEAKNFIIILNIFGKENYRLPTEAEFEYAERAGTTTTRYWGENIDDGCLHENIASLEYKHENQDKITANCKDGYLFTSPVGAFPPNQFGLYDILGNVWEFTEDCWHENFNGAPTDGSAWGNEDCTDRVQKGGGFDGTPGIIRSSDRYHLKTDYRGHETGFRIAKD